MKAILATLYKVECNFTWEDKNSSSTWSFGSLEGAKKFVEKKKDELRWYSIEGLDYMPCDDDDPYGQLYQGMIYFEFNEFEENEKEELS